MSFLNMFSRKKDEKQLTEQKEEILKEYRQKEKESATIIDSDTLKTIEILEKISIENDNKIKEIQFVVLSLLSDHKRTKATEEISKSFLEHHDIYTIRSDKDTEMWIYCDGIYIPKGKTYVLEWCREILGEAYTTQLHNEVLSKIQADTFIESKEFFTEKNRDLIPLLNGIYDLKNKKLIDFDSKKIFFNKLPLTYNPDAKCDNIIKHFNVVLENPEQDLLVIQEMFGNLLLKNYKHEKAFMFLGTGRNGKGKTLLLIEHFLGKENCTNIPLQHLDQRQFAISDLFGKLANLGGDLSATALKETGNFKQVTGGDLLTADRKFKESITFQNYAKMIFCANELPKSYDDTYAFFARWIMFNFPYTFVTKQEYELLNKKEQDTHLIKIADQDLINKLTTKEELSGLFNWALTGLERLEQQKGFSFSKTTDQVKNEWTRKSDSFSAFFMDCIEMTTPAQYVEKKVLSNAYSQYCKEKGLKQENRNHINSYLIKKGAYEDKIKIKENGEIISQPYVFFGIKIKENSNNSESSNNIDSIQKLNFPIDMKTTELSELSEPKVIFEDLRGDI